MDIKLVRNQRKNLLNVMVRSLLSQCVRALVFGSCFVSSVSCLQQACRQRLFFAQAIQYAAVWCVGSRVVESGDRRRRHQGLAGGNGTST
jgi:hypothetical protein